MPDTAPDHHAQTAIELFGDASPANRERAKIINFMSAYDAGEIAKARLAGMYPLPRLSLFGATNHGRSLRA